MRQASFGIIARRENKINEHSRPFGALLDLLSSTNW
jgi:hypothetical protein